MNKFLTLTAGISLAVFACVPAYGQAVLGYTVEEAQGAYTPLSDATVIFDGETAPAPTGDFEDDVFTPEGIVTDDTTSAGYEIGFDVNVAGNSFSRFIVGAAGYIQLGNSDLPTACLGNRWLDEDADLTAVGFSNRMGYAYENATTVSYKTLGSGEDQRLVVQFENFGMNYNFWGDPVFIDIQVAIFADGKVEYTFSDFGNLEKDQNMPLYIGIKAGSYYVCTSGFYGEDLKLDINPSYMSDTRFYDTVADGAMLVFNAPDDCVTPLAQPTDLVLTATSVEIEVEFTASESADTYLVLYAPKGSELSAPEDGVVYPTGSEYGDGWVASYGSETSFTLNNVPGGVDYDFYVYAVNSYGGNGPKYLDSDPLTGSVYTLPEGAKSIEFVIASLDSLIFNVESNEADDEIVVVYNSYCDRSMYGDHGLFGELPEEPQVGDVIAVPEGFEPPYAITDAPEPENAGVVAYVGKAGEVKIDNLDASTPYYIGVYTRSSNGSYTSNPLYDGASTVISAPYDGDAYNFPRFRLPFGWSGSVDGETSVGFLDALFFTYGDAPSRGTQVVQQQARVNAGDAVNGKEAWLVPVPVDVNERHLIAKFDYSLNVAASRFSNLPYNDWEENDVLELQVSTDGGETWTTLNSYTAEEHPTLEDVNSYASISADLNDYRGETVLVKLYWKTYSVAPFGTTAYVERFSVLQGDFPAVPEVSVSKVTDNSAVVSWTSQQEDYQMIYNVVGSDAMTVVSVKGASTYTLENLQTNTEYEVKVRGLLVDEEGNEAGYSEWSDVVTFTTADYPEVEAPVDLVADVETLAASEVVLLSWSKVEEAESYEVAYRLSTATEWTTMEALNNSAMLAELESGATYIWKVKAFCTHDRETAYSAQSRFVTPEKAGVNEVGESNVRVYAVEGAIVVEGDTQYSLYTVAGEKVADGKVAGYTEIPVAPGLYLVLTENTTYRVLVK